MLLGIGADATARRAVSPVPLEVKVLDGNVIAGPSCGEENTLSGQQSDVVFDDDVVHRDDGEGFGYVADIDGMHLSLGPRSATVLNSQRGVVRANRRVGAQRGFQIG